MSTEFLRVDELLSAGAKLANARVAEQLAARDVHALIKKYVGGGWSKTEVAEALGVSRQTVYNVLGGVEDG